MDYTSEDEDIIKFGISTLIKLICFYSIIITIISVLVMTLGWILSMAFSGFSHFEATLIPLFILGFSSILLGIVSIWVRLGDIAFTYESPLLNDENIDDDEYDYYCDDDTNNNNQKPVAKGNVTPFPGKKIKKNNSSDSFN